MPEITEKDLPQSQKALWLKALSAVQTQNHAFAITLLQAVLTDSPAFLDGRKLLRKVEIQAAGGAKKKGGLFGGGGLGVMKLQTQAKKDPAGTIPLIEKELEKDPFNENANDLLFETFMRMELPDSAAFALETVRKGQPETPKLLHKLAGHYLSRDLPGPASEVFADILKIAPHDSDAIKGAKDATARASMQQQKWDENSDMRSLMRDQSQFEEMEKASRTGLTRDQLEERRDKLVLKYNEDTNHLGTVKDRERALRRG
jgi:predicted Zn-dependent protease